MTNKACVIVGASHAGVQLALSLRQGGWNGSIKLISEEAGPPYQRPPLSKGVLSGDKSSEAIPLRPAALYEKSELEFISGHRATRISPPDHVIELDNGTSIHYDKLALTLGARPRILPIEGAQRQGVFYLRSLADVEHIRPWVQPGKSAVILGGGYIGLEAATALTQAGMKVTVIESASRVLQRVTAPVVSSFFERVHCEEGVDLQLDKQVVSIDGDQRVNGVSCVDGSHHPADLVLIAVGVVPNSELAQEAGLRVDNGVCVDEFAQTSDPDTFAAGDCASFHSSLYQRHIRLESVQNATDQSRAAAASINGNPQPYQATPWFWSDQFDIKLQIAGLSQGYDSAVLRGDPENGRSFAVFYFEGDRLLAVDAINRPAEFMAGKRLAGQQLSQAREKISDESIPIKEFLS